MVRRSIMAGRFRETALMAKKPGGKRSTKNVLCLPDLDHSKTSVLQSLIVGLATLFSIPVSVIAVAAGVALRESKIAQKNRRLIWCAFLSSFAFAPTVVALTPLLLTRRR
jgi:hypothetical protein